MTTYRERVEALPSFGDDFTVCRDDAMDIAAEADAQIAELEAEVAALALETAAQRSGQ